MLRTIMFFSIFWIGLILSLPLMIPYYILKLSGAYRSSRKYVKFITSNWAKFTLFTAGIKVILTGTENIPVKKTGFAVISNHEGNFDIPVFIAILPFSPGFIAKKELMKFPFLSNWMRALQCLPIDRKNPRFARKKICARIRQEWENPLVLFPEGTRSRGKTMGIFKTGSLKLMFHNQLEILPVSIIDTYKGFEERKNIHPAHVKVRIHPLIRTSLYQPTDFNIFLEDLQKIISTGRLEDA
jgi:1-acyl-sn-glycerol-3-phosphate acyltransferase